LLLKEDGSTQMIRRAERESDYFVTFEGLGILDDMVYPEGTK